MAVPNSIEFMQWADISMPGSLYPVVDALIEHGRPTGNTIDSLYIVYTECKDWLKKNVSSFLSSKKDLRKESAVNRTLGEVFTDLNAKQAGLGTALQNYGIKKGADGKVRGKMATLGAGYANERASYKASGKTQAPYSGTRVHQMAQHTGDNFERLNVRQFEQLAGDVNVSAQVFASRTIVRMYFLNKIQRLKFLVTCDQSGAAPRWVDIAGTPVHTQLAPRATKGEERACMMWAMDCYGNLFVDYTNAGHGRFVLGDNQNPAQTATRTRGQMNHSSFCAGRDVICAGNIFFWRGQLIHIDNGSGHYAPNRDALFKAVSILWNAGAALDYLRVGVLPGANQAWLFYRARTFLANNGVAADWPQQDWTRDQDNVFAACVGFQP